MLIVGLRGGLGNQMFQYALGRSMARRRGEAVFLDVGALSERTPYGLHLFTIDVPLLQAQETARISQEVLTACAVNEGRPGFAPQALEPGNHPLIIFNGFWQSERYFLDVADLLRMDFTLREPTLANSPHLESLQQPNAVCVHVRRQDYVSGGGQHLGFIGVDYYRRALATLIERVPDAHFFVFSDDIDWCARHLPITHTHTFVDYDPGPCAAALTLSLMSRCAHFVIGNSTFSWWAAWLGPAADKTVIAPRGWFASERDSAAVSLYGPLSSKDLVPAAWLRL